MAKELTDLAITRESLYGMTEEPTYSGITSFLRRRYTRDLTGVDVAVTGVPYDLATTNRPGTRLGPRGIRAASTIMAWGDAVDGWNFDPFKDLAVVDVGDCNFDPGRPEQVPEAIYQHARGILNEDVALLSLGGDHFISYPLLRAHAEKHGPLSLIHFDAHCDTWEDEEGRIDHGTMFYHAAKEGIVDAAHSVQVGMRTFNVDSHGYQVYDADWVHENGAKATIDVIKETVGNRPCYLTFDIDCLDPAFAPGTGTPCYRRSEHSTGTQNFTRPRRH